jgi:hypothetical protein
MRYLILLLIAIFLTSCEDKKFSHIYQKSIIGKPIKALSISCTNQKVLDLTKEALRKRGIKLLSKAPYTLTVEYGKYAKHCDKPASPSYYESSYDGYLKLILSKGLKRVYMIQKDFHGKLSVDDILELIEGMSDELKWD